MREAVLFAEESLNSGNSEYAMDNYFIRVSEKDRPQVHLAIRQFWMVRATAACYWTDVTEQNRTKKLWS